MCLLLSALLLSPIISESLAIDVNISFKVIKRTMEKSILQPKPGNANNRSAAIKEGAEEQPSSRSLDVFYGTTMRWAWFSGYVPSGAVSYWNSHASRSEYPCVVSDCSAGYYSSSRGPYCYYTGGNKEYSTSHFKILVNDHYFESLSWRPGSWGNVPSNSINTCSGQEMMFACLLCLLFACNLLPVLLAGKGSSSCVFPFVFNRRPYSSCTRDGAIDEQLWCSTTSNYDTDGQWKHCILQEYGGNSGGKSCVFPFVYKNQTFYTCTKEEKGRFWCATTRNYDKDLQWSYCADTRLDANPKGPCVFPFIFNHKSYSSCTSDGISNKKPWCSLTKNYDIDFLWTYCEPSASESREKEENLSCVFPFVYDGKLHFNCTTEGRSDGKRWCATTINYDLDKKWKFCPEELGTEPQQDYPTCVFPFIYKGKFYNVCIDEDMGNGKFWCSTSSNYDKDKKWQYFNVTGPDPMIQSPSCVFPFVFKEKVYSTCTNEGMSDGKFWCATTSNYDVDKKWAYCNDTGPEENVESRPCVFPFVFKNQIYTGCTTNGRSDGRYWCATSSNYDIDKMWRFCSEELGPDPNVEDPTCVFPFIYKDKLYTTCTGDGMRNGRCWCATTSNYDVDKKWTYCNITDPDPKIDGPTCVFPFIYNGNSYSTCISNGMRDGKKWCATTGNYDVDKKWMCCNDTGPGTTEETHKCVFPFIYNGKSYNSCTSDGQEDGKLWCAITKNYDVDKRLTFCTITKTGCVFPFIYKGKQYESCTTIDHNEGKTWCATTPDYKTGLKWRLCNEADCVFPFIFRGQSYDNCTSDGRADNKRWCSLTGNADTNHSWLLC